MRLARLLDAKSEEEWIEERLGALAKAASNENIAGEADRIGALLKAAGVGREGVCAAVVIGLVSQGMSLGELEMLRRVANAAGVAEEALGPMIDDADIALMGQ